MSDYPNLTELKASLIGGDRVALAKAITLVESTKKEHLELGSELVAACMLSESSSRRIGVTGVPGVGKSTFIDAFGSMLTINGHKVAVLAVDPSSDVSQGSILGDKTRMEKLASDSNAFIRPTAAGGTLGGVARKTRETIILCEAAGYDTILIETVGVGQSETAVHSMVDMFMLLVLATAGDELQGIKRGIMEMADMVVINKDDGENAVYTKLAKASYHQALHMFRAKENGWVVPVGSCSAINGIGLDQVIESVDSYFQQVGMNGILDSNRSGQNVYWLKQAITDELMQRFYRDEKTDEELRSIESDIKNGTLNPFSAARKLLKNWGYKS
ncbi:methylmalonyl Co-A mutase-associated GTPase MeaB [Flavobacteriales bacterium]|nr:methylmalonyl Co-A mutase-associated GTPase MeaB [Flavobacteriales bacterium]